MAGTLEVRIAWSFLPTSELQAIGFGSQLVNPQDVSLKVLINIQIFYRHGYDYDFYLLASLAASISNLLAYLLSSAASLLSSASNSNLFISS